MGDTIPKKSLEHRQHCLKQKERRNKKERKKGGKEGEKIQPIEHRAPCPHRHVDQEEGQSESYVLIDQQAQLIKKIKGVYTKWGGRKRIRGEGPQGSSMEVIM